MTPNTKAISVRFSHDELRQLKTLCKEHGQALGPYVRAQLFAAARNDEKAQVLQRVDGLEKLLGALLWLQLEAVVYQRDGKSSERVDRVRAEAHEKVLSTCRALLGRELARN